MLEQFQTTVASMEYCGSDILIVRFAKPAAYAFRAGQWFRLTLATEEGEQTKTFSHASAPDDEWIEMGTRLSGSAFKNALAALSEGVPAALSAPGGRLALDDAVVRAGFLAGGVGITPIRSILRDRSARGVAFDDAVLLFGNRDIACVPWGDELDALRSLGVRVVHVPETPPQGWPGESGFITSAMVRRHAPRASELSWVVAGPPVMVRVMEKVLDELGVSEDRRLVERFGARDSA